MLDFCDEPYCFFEPKPSRAVMAMSRTVNRFYSLGNPNHRISEFVISGHEERLRELFTELEFRQWLAELGEGETPTTPDPVNREYELVLTAEELDPWLERLASAGEFAFDTETTSLDYMQAVLVGVSFAVEEGKAAYVPCGHDYEGAPEQIETGELLEAAESLRELKEMEEEVAEDQVAPFHAIHWREVEALLMLKRGETIDGLGLLTRAAQLEMEQRQIFNDPPTYPRMLYNVLGEQYIAVDSPTLAIAAFHVALAEVPNDAFALAGLARAHFELGERELAAEFYGRFLHVWSDAEPGLRTMEQVAALGIEADPTDVSPGAQRSYSSVVLDSLGPERWEPYAAPKLEARDSDGEKVTLEDYRGRPVLLVFYLGEQCPHCVEQLVAIRKRFPDFEASEVAVLAVSSDTPEVNSEFLKSGEIPYRLLSDAEFRSAGRFGSYDDFEEIELHSTFVIDRDGRVRWSRIGGGPFMDVDFLLDEIDRIDEQPWRGPEQPESMLAGGAS